MFDKISFDEKYGVFTIQKQVLGMFYVTSAIIYEKDINIRKDNELRRLAGITVLTDNDIDLLYQFAVKEFNYPGNKDDFENTTLSDVFVGVKDLKVDKLMTMSHDYLRGKPVVIEKFNGNNNNYLILFLIVLMLIICFL